MLDERTIINFIKDYSQSRIIISSTVLSICNRVMKYETNVGKSMTEFSIEEILEFYRNSSAISVTSLMNTNLLLKHLCSWLNNSTDNNPYATINKQDLIPLVNHRSLLSRTDILDAQDQLLNATDKAIIEALWLGIGGEWLAEVTYLDPRQISDTDMKIYFRNGKVIDINKQQYDLFQNAFNETSLISYNLSSMKISKVSGYGLFKTRFNSIHDSQNKDSTEDQERRYRYIQRRLKIISDYLGVKFTPSLLSDSGLGHYLKQGIKQNDLTFREFLHTAECKKLARRYDIMSDLYIQIIANKFEGRL